MKYSGQITSGNDHSSFICGHCHNVVTGTAPGTNHRNHCPSCLWSRHVDLRSGDRRASCRGMMEPLAVGVRADGEWYIIHRCEKCGFLRSNRIAGDDAEGMLLSLAMKPLRRLAFPLEQLTLKQIVPEKEEEV